MQTCQSIVLVTPVWNDSKRLAIFAPELGAAICDSNLPILWVIADDGSNASERLKYEEITDYVRTLGCKVDTIRLKDRSFKGGVIYEAWNNYPQADWLAFVDADGAVSAKSILDLIYLNREKGEDACVVAVRSDQEKIQCVVHTNAVAAAIYLYAFGSIHSRFRASIHSAALKSYLALRIVPLPHNYARVVTSWMLSF